jgi:hypothetical protein
MKRNIMLDKIASDKFALELTYVITNKDLFTTLENAKNKIKDWEKPSRKNKGLSIGTHWNLFCKDLKLDSDISEMHKYRILEQYKEFLPIELKEVKVKTPKSKPTHQNPIFDNFF